LLTRSLPEDHSAEAVGVHQLSVGLPLLDARLRVDHSVGVVVRVLVQPPSRPVVASLRVPGHVLAGLLAIPARPRRRRRVFVARPPGRRQHVQRLGAPIQRAVVDAQPTANGAVHCARQQQRVEDGDGGVRVRRRRRRRWWWSVRAQGPAHAQLHADHHQEDEETVQPIQPVQERRQEPVPDHRRAGQRPGHTAQTGLPVQAQQQGPEQGMEEEIRRAV